MLALYILAVALLCFVHLRCLVWAGFFHWVHQHVALANLCIDSHHCMQPTSGSAVTGFHSLNKVWLGLD